MACPLPSACPLAQVSHPPKNSISLSHPEVGLSDTPGADGLAKDNNRIEGG